MNRICVISTAVRELRDDYKYQKICRAAMSKRRRTEKGRMAVLLCATRFELPEQPIPELTELRPGNKTSRNIVSADTFTVLPAKKASMLIIKK
jgi:hypothetical protein